MAITGCDGRRRQKSSVLFPGPHAPFSNHPWGQCAAGKSSGSSKCAPEQYVGDAPDPSLPHNGEINPCGLIAWSFFNDSYSAAMLGPGGAPMPVELDVRPSLNIPSRPTCVEN